MSDTNGNFVWYTMLSTDVEASKAFYTGLFGWNQQSMDIDGAEITMLLNGDSPLGGIKAHPMPGAPSAWIGYIGVDNVDATLEKATKMGGKAPGPATDIPPGRFAFLNDPQGAWLAVFSHANDEVPISRKTETGDFGWAELATTDVDGAKGFYGENFNWGSGQVMNMGDGQYHMVMRGEDPVAGMFTKPAEMPVSAWTFYVNVTDVEASVAKAQELGGKVMMPPMTVPDMVTFAVLADPAGGVVGIAQSLK